MHKTEGIKNDLVKFPRFLLFSIETKFIIFENNKFQLILIASMQVITIYQPTAVPKCVFIRLFILLLFTIKINVAQCAMQINVCSRLENIIPRLRFAICIDSRLLIHMTSYSKTI